MRPIDADALKEQLEYWLEQIRGYTSDEHEITRDVLMSVIHSYIADMPTLDVQPVFWKCSVCGDKEHPDYNMCPRCGARRDGGGE